MFQALRILLIIVVGALSGGAASVTVIALAPAEIWHGGDWTTAFDLDRPWPDAEETQRDGRSRTTPRDWPIAPAVAGCDKLERDSQLQVSIGSGDCLIRAGGVRLTAARVVLDEVSGRATATGGVHWVDGDGMSRVAETVALDGGTETAVANSFRRVLAAQESQTTTDGRGRIRVPGWLSDAAAADGSRSRGSLSSADLSMPDLPPPNPPTASHARPLPSAPPDPPVWKRRGVDPMASVSEVVARLDRNDNGSVQPVRAIPVDHSTGAPGDASARTGTVGCDRRQRSGGLVIGLGNCRVEVDGTGLVADRFEVDPVSGVVTAFGSVAWWQNGGPRHPAPSAHLADPLRRTVLSYLTGGAEGEAGRPGAAARPGSEPRQALFRDY